LISFWQPLNNSTIKIKKVSVQIVAAGVLLNELFMMFDLMDKLMLPICLSFLYSTVWQLKSAGTYIWLHNEFYWR